MVGSVSSATRIGFLGPLGTFTEEALRREPTLAAGELTPLPSFVHVLDAVTSGQVDLGFVALENSIEGTVSVALDGLVFDQSLLIVREAVLPVTQNLLTVPGADVDALTEVVSIPIAIAQCRRWLAAHLPDAVERAAPSTAEAARLVAERGNRLVAAIGPAVAGERYGLALAVPHVEDSPDNLTRFVLVGPPSQGIPAPTGHDKTSIVCFQSANRPGSLHGILGQFSARDINLVKLESRPTKHRLGDYCFVIDFEGHVADEVVADCLRDLHATLREVRFLGSYPAAGEHGPAIRRDAHQAWQAADRWIAELQDLIHENEE